MIYLSKDFPPKAKFPVRMKFTNCNNKKCPDMKQLSVLSIPKISG